VAEIRPSSNRRAHARRLLLSFFEPQREERLRKIEAELGSPLQTEPATIKRGATRADPRSRRRVRLSLVAVQM
jgi:hypothetical protein